MRRGDERNALVDELNHRACIERGEGDGGLKAIGTIGIGAAIVIEHDALAGGHLHLTVVASGDDNHVLHRAATIGVAAGGGNGVAINSGRNHLGIDCCAVLCG